MGHYTDFLESLLGDNVMHNFDKILRELAYSESVSKIHRTDWTERLRASRMAFETHTQRHLKRLRAENLKHK